MFKEKERRFRNEVRKTVSKERRKGSKGATRHPVRKERQPIVIAWKKITRYAAVMLMFIAVVMLGTWIQEEERLPVLHVTVEGEFKHASKALLEKTVKPYVTGNFMTINVSKLREAGEAQAWIKSIQVQRHWPDSVHLVVEEQKAIAQWADDGLVNTTGDLFFPSKSSFPKALVKLEGLNEESRGITRRYAEIVKEFKPLGLKISQLKMDKRYAWFIQFNNGLELLLGRADNKQRLARFKMIYQAGLYNYFNEIKTIDMRYTNGVSVVWKSGQQPEFNGKV